jgi:hypothetical protein
VGIFHWLNAKSFIFSDVKALQKKINEERSY